MGIDNRKEIQKMTFRALALTSFQTQSCLAYTGFPALYYFTLKKKNVL